MACDGNKEFFCPKEWSLIYCVRSDMSLPQTYSSEGSTSKFSHAIICLRHRKKAYLFSSSPRPRCICMTQEMDTEHQSPYSLMNNAESEPKSNGIGTNLPKQVSRVHTCTGCGWLFVQICRSLKSYYKLPLVRCERQL